MDSFGLQAGDNQVQQNMQQQAQEVQSAQQMNQINHQVPQMTPAAPFTEILTKNECKGVVTIHSLGSMSLCICAKVRILDIFEFITFSPFE